jgi:hypothetical protein
MEVILIILVIIYKFVFNPIAKNNYYYYLNINCHYYFSIKYWYNYMVVGAYITLCTPMFSA